MERDDYLKHWIRASFTTDENGKDRLYELIPKYPLHEAFMFKIPMDEKHDFLVYNSPSASKIFMIVFSKISNYIITTEVAGASIENYINSILTKLQNIPEPSIPMEDTYYRMWCRFIDTVYKAKDTDDSRDPRAIALSEFAKADLSVCNCLLN